MKLWLQVLKDLWRVVVCAVKLVPKLPEIIRWRRTCRKHAQRQAAERVSNLAG